MSEGEGGGAGRTTFDHERAGRPQGHTFHGCPASLPHNVKTNARHLCRKNADVVRLAIQLSRREAAKEAATKAKVALHAKERDRLLRRLSDMRCNSDEDESHASTYGSDDDDDDAPPHVGAYTGRGTSTWMTGRGRCQ
ncbi:Polygalacturonase ADPG1 [Hordeum vulgare]|nr:Polygalacturonase ADPG1 [Hordeum vulgare]